MLHDDSQTNLTGRCNKMIRKALGRSLIPLSQSACTWKINIKLACWVLLHLYLSQHDAFRKNMKDRDCICPYEPTLGKLKMDGWKFLKISILHEKINEGSSKPLNHPPLNSTTTLNMLHCKIFSNSIFSLQQFVIPLVIYAAINAPSSCLSPLKSLKLMI